MTQSGHRERVIANAMFTPLKRLPAIAHAIAAQEAKGRAAAAAALTARQCEEAFEQSARMRALNGMPCEGANRHGRPLANCKAKCLPNPVEPFRRRGC